MQHRLRDIAERLGGEVLSGGDVCITGVARLDLVEPGQLTYVTAKRYLEEAEKSPAAALLVPPGLAVRKPAVAVSNPLLAYARLLAWLYPAPLPQPGSGALAAPPGSAAAGGERREEPEVWPAAWVDAQAQVDAGATVMPLAFVGPQARIGPRCLVAPGVYVGAGVELGGGTIVHANVTLYDGVRIGQNCAIHAGSVIGSDGFGYVLDEEGRHVKIPQLGTVIIEDDVEIGANVCIDRATQGATRIGRGTKIDNHVHIGHNVTVGPHSLLVAQVGISGSCRLGHHVVLAGQVGVRDHVTIGDGAMAAGGAGIVRDVPPGARVAGVPAFPHKEWLQAVQIIPRLPELRRRIQSLEHRLRDLEQQRGAPGRSS
ncbi:MAG: UDP-3-O-(3-hydroxymyristoyl)glucosamine N-acyltransferase [Candidatus Tectomicrobia bacterium]|nr:UDP-3-O-(3-hydroxymyristoyl)glucosamine N-acyltransferase [Candidatus Tectomicrobia bacterium]